MTHIKNNVSYFFAGWEAAKAQFDVLEGEGIMNDLKEHNGALQWLKDYESGEFDPLKENDK